MRIATEKKSFPEDSQKLSNVAQDFVFGSLTTERSKMLEGLTREELIVKLNSLFRHVTRSGGVSWIEAEVIDGYGSKEERVKARASETDQNWMDVALDTKRWENNWGPWGFLDDIGFRYYLVAAIARDIILDKQTLNPSFFCPRSLNFGHRYLLPQERTFIAQYVQYKSELPKRNALMAVLEEADMTFEQYLESGETWTPETWSDWSEPLEYWKKFLPPNSKLSTSS
ncbi:MAG: DUF6714 family protein [Armatimonadota bacterium]